MIGVSKYTEDNTTTAFLLADGIRVYHFDEFVVLIRLLLIMPIVLNWACNGMFSQKARAVKVMSLVVFMLQS